MEHCKWRASIIQHGAGFYGNLLMATIDSQRDDLDSLCQIWSSGTRVERILSCLNNPARNLFKINGDAQIANYAPLSVVNQLARWTSSSWDVRMSNPKFKRLKVVRSLKKQIIVTSKSFLCSHTSRDCATRMLHQHWSLWRPFACSIRAYLTAWRTEMSLLGAY